MDQLLQYLAAINGHSNIQLTQMTPDVTPSSTSSEDSSPSSSQTSPSYKMEEEVTSDDESITSATSDRQLRPRVPISYNETVLKCLHGQPQVRNSTCPYHFQETVQKKIQTQKSRKQMKKANSSYKH